MCLLMILIQVVGQPSYLTVPQTNKQKNDIQGKEEDAELIAE